MVSSFFKKKEDDFLSNVDHIAPWIYFDLSHVSHVQTEVIRVTDFRDYSLNRTRVGPVGANLVGM